MRSLTALLSVSLLIFTALAAFAVTPIPVGSAKRLADGATATVSGVVSRVTSDRAYVQAVNRSAGIRIDNPSALGLVEVNLVTITGKLSTRDGERILVNCSLVSSTTGSAPNPVFVSSRSLKQSGPTGLLVRAAGYVTSVSNDGTFQMYDGGTIVGKCAGDVATPIPNSFVVITGISSTDGGSPAKPAVYFAHDDCRLLDLPLGSNLIRNPGAEQGPSSADGSEVRPIPGWVCDPGFTQTNYGYIFTAEEGSRIGGGRNFFFGGLNTAQSTAKQSIDVSPLASLISARQIRATVSGWAGVRDTEGDRAHIRLIFYDGQGNLLSYTTMGPYSGTSNTMVYHEKALDVPSAARTLEVKLIGVRYNGKNNDEFYDNLSLVLSRK
jgi:hypothetical protein